MKLWKKLSLCFVLALFVVYTNQTLCYASGTDASTASWALKQSLSVDSCKQGDSILLSVYLNNTSGKGELTVSQMACVLEYDMSLFSVSDVTADSMLLEVSDYENGNFIFSNSSGKSFSNGDLLFQIQMDAEGDSLVGKTTICVTDINFQKTDGEAVTIQNFTPVSVVIEKSTEKASSKEEETENKAVSGDKSETEETNAEKKNTTNSGKEKENTAVTGTSKSDNISNGQKTLDKNYKTGAGLGNDSYFLIAGLLAVLVLVAVAMRKKLLSKMKF